MTKILNRMTACLLTVVLLVSYTPLCAGAAEMESLYETAQDDIIIEDADVIDDASEAPEEETDLYVSPDDENDVLLSDNSALEERADEVALEETTPEELSGTEESAQEFLGVYNVSVYWPDGASNKIVLRYYGSDREDVANNISVLVAEELNKFDVHESEYTCVPTWNRKKSKTEKVAIKNDDGIVIGHKIVTTDTYDVKVTTIQPPFADEPDDVQVLAHRGTVNVPENTLSAFRVSAVKGSTTSAPTSTLLLTVYR